MRMKQTEFITGRQIYSRVIQERIPRAERFVWIGTSDIKDMYVEKSGSMVPFLEILASLAKKNVSIRLIHAKEPGPAFREDFDRYPVLIKGMEKLLCPRVHFKCVIIDGKFAYTGSANLTGAGMGAKGPDNRNFESGIITTNPQFISDIMDQFDSVWMGKYCKQCRRKEYCADFADILKGR